MDIIEAKIDDSGRISVKFNTYIHWCRTLNGYHYCQREFSSDIIGKLVSFNGILYKMCESHFIYVSHFIFFTFEPV